MIVLYPNLCYNEVCYKVTAPLGLHCKIGFHEDVSYNSFALSPRFVLRNLYLLKIYLFLLPGILYQVVLRTLVVELS